MSLWKHQQIAAADRAQSKQGGNIFDVSPIDSSQRRLPEDEHTAAFPPGQRVKHFVFGVGTVVDVDWDKGAHVVQFDDMSTPRRISFRAGLEPCPPGAEGGQP